MRLEGTMENGSVQSFDSVVHINEYGKGDRTTAAPNVWVILLLCMRNTFGMFLSV